MQRIILLKESDTPFLDDDEVLCSYTKEEVNYYLKKYEFWKETGIIGNKDDVE